MRREPKTVPTMNGCRRALPRWHNSIQADTARWKSVSSWSNRFVSVSALVLLAACQSAPPKDSPNSSPTGAGEPSAEPVESHAGAAAKAGTAAAASKPSAAAPAAANAAAAPAAPTPVAPQPAAPQPAAPIPERAAQQYAQALQFMKS